MPSKWRRSVTNTWRTIVTDDSLSPQVVAEGRTLPLLVHFPASVERSRAALQGESPVARGTRWAISMRSTSAGFASIPVGPSEPSPVEALEEVGLFQVLFA